MEKKDFKCSKCDKEFTSKQNLVYHENKKVCDRMGKNICSFCERQYSTPFSLCRHKKTCKKKNKKDEDRSDKTDDKTCDEIKEERTTYNDGDIKEIFERLLKLEQENNVLKKELNEKNNAQNTQNVKKVVKNTKNTQNINNTQNTNNGTINNNNIILVGYGKEDMSKIDYDDIIKSVSYGFNSPLEMIDTVHFNPKYPEFHNVYISNMKNEYAMKYDGEAWTLVPKQEAVEGLYNSKRNYIEENIDEFVGSLSPSKMNALNRMLDANDSHEYVKKIKNYIKLLLYNKRNIVIDTKNKIENKANIGSK